MAKVFAFDSSETLSYFSLFENVVIFPKMLYLYYMGIFIIFLWWDWKDTWSNCAVFQTMKIVSRRRICETELLPWLSSREKHFYPNESFIDKLRLFQLRYLGDIFLKINEANLLP
jgi:hypothetical protein